MSNDKEIKDCQSNESPDEDSSSSTSTKHCLTEEDSKDSTFKSIHQYQNNETSSIEFNKEDTSQNGGDDDSLSSSSSSSSSSSATSATSDSMTRLNEMNDDDEDDQDDPDLEEDLMVEKELISNDSNCSSSTVTSPTTSSSSSNSTTATVTTNSKSADESPEPLSSNDTRRRVKLYMLNANRTWDDRGTGHVSSSYIDRLNGMSLLVKAETDGSTLLESKIMADTAYQKQQDTLIVWSEGENYDLALSFQERIGCEEIWAKICQVQGKDPSVDITQDLIEDEDNELPPIEIGRLDEINSILTSSLTTASKKDNITLALESDNYILKLLELFRQLEDRQDIQSLQKIYEIFKNIFLLNKNSLIEIMLSDNAICDVIGVFEYDPNGARVREANKNQQLKDDSRQRWTQSTTSTSTETSSTRALSSQSNSYFTSLPSSSETELMRLVREKRHREFLRNVSRFKEVIPLSKSELVSKIHQTYRVQYIQDVIMPTPSVFEENMLSTLSSVLFFNKIEIVTLIQEDEKFLKELFRQLSDDTPTFNEKRRDLVLFLKELCTFSHTLQNRETFIKTLSSLGLLQTIETLLVCDDPVIKLGAVDLLTYIVDYSPSMVREYALQQEINTDKPTEQYIINIIIEQMICDIDPDLGMAQQLSGILKMIIDPDNMLTTPGLNKTEKSEFLNYFYKHCIYYLTAPILAATFSSNDPQHQHQPTSGSLTGGTTNSASQNSTIITTSITGEPLRLAFENSCQAAQLLAIILELLTFCIEHHAYHIRTYLLQKEIVRRIMILTKSRHTFLVLTVIRFMRKLVGLKDEFYNRHIVTMNLFQPIVDAFLSNKGRYNLLDSAVIDLFEFIDHNDIYTLLNYTVERFWKCKLEHVDYVRTFKSLKSHYDQQQRRNTAQNQLMFSQRNRFRRDPRQLDKEEDMWFNADDDDDEEECADEDDDDECENYHEDDEDGSPPPAPQSSSNIENRLAASLSDPVDYAHQQYSGLSLHHAKHTSLNTVGSPVLHHHQLHLSSLHQNAGTNNSSTSVGSISNYNSLTATANSLYDTPSAVAFVDSPFFSSLASVTAAATSGTSGTGGITSGIVGKKKTNDRKLTINLNHKTTSFLSSGTNNVSNNQQNNNNQNNQQSANVLSAFSSGLCNSLSSINSSIAAVAAAAAECVNAVTTSTTSCSSSTSNHSGSSLLSSSSASSSSLPFRSANQLMGQAAVAAAAAAAAFHLNNNTNSTKTTDATSTVLSRKALVDYPDEDSDEEEQEQDDEDDDVEGEENDEDQIEDDLEDEHESTFHYSTSNVRVNIHKSSTFENKKDYSSLALKRRSKFKNQVVNCATTSSDTNEINQVLDRDSITTLTTNKHNSSEEDHTNTNKGDDQVTSSSASATIPIGDCNITNVLMNNMIMMNTNNSIDHQLSRKRKPDNNDDDDQRININIETKASTSTFINIDESSSYSESLVTSDTSSSTLCSSTASESSTSVTKRFRYSFVESDSTTTNVMISGCSSTDTSNQPNDTIES